MNFLVITNVAHYSFKNSIFGYAPYILEMNIWIKNVAKLTVVAPMSDKSPTEIDAAYQHSNVEFKEILAFNCLNLLATFKTIVALPKILFKIAKAMKKADHIHLRCPSNLGLLGCIVQIFFPKKIKTAKYAGNWDLKAAKPLTYRVQQWILNNTFLTKNMQVLVYGEWEGSSTNIKPFFTATYSQYEIIKISEKNVNTALKCIFVGTLVAGKNPFYAIQLVQKLQNFGIDVSLDLYGDGVLRPELQNYITTNKLGHSIFLKGNVSKENLKKCYQESQFLILPSESEGWPKAVAEAMFWGCVPVTTNVSCVSEMIGNGTRGLLLTLDLDKDFLQLKNICTNNYIFSSLSLPAIAWSQQYTIEKFDTEIQRLLR